VGVGHRKALFSGALTSRQIIGRSTRCLSNKPDKLAGPRLLTAEVSVTPFSCNSA
jgi:hypothetical protein